PENSALSAAGTAAAMSVGEMLLLRGTGKLRLGEYGVSAKAGEKVYAHDGILGPKGGSPETVTYFRTEGGGSGTKTSQNRITANGDGTITINPGCA
ncbi:hypothetical protein, partial [Pseudomonas viridiflava]|uniref:hypothetical protein n=1 Tax=Pseudomonas viridiflava TaxID=33069 RepID=UPI0019CFA4F7